MTGNLSSSFTPAQLAAFNSAGRVLSGNLQRRVSGYDNDYLMKVLGQVGLGNDFSQADPTLMALMGQTANLPQVSSYLQQSAGATPMTTSNNTGMNPMMMNPAMMMQMMGMGGMPPAPAAAPKAGGFDMASMFSNMMGTNQNPMSLFGGGVPSAQSNPMLAMFGMGSPEPDPMTAMMQQFMGGGQTQQVSASNPMAAMMGMMNPSSMSAASLPQMMMNMMMPMFFGLMQQVMARFQPQPPVVVEVPDPGPEPAPKPVAKPKPSPKPLPKPVPVPPKPPTEPAPTTTSELDLAQLIADLFPGGVI